MGRDRKNRAGDELSETSQKLMRLMVTDCLKAQGLPTDAKAVDGAIELIKAGFAVIRSDGASYWLEATHG